MKEEYKQVGDDLWFEIMQVRDDYGSKDWVKRSGCIWDII